MFTIKRLFRLFLCIGALHSTALFPMFQDTGYGDFALPAIQGLCENKDGSIEYVPILSESGKQQHLKEVERCPLLQQSARKFSPEHLVCAAALYGNQQLLDYAILQGESVNTPARYISGGTPLHIAAGRRDLEMVEHLILQHGADPNSAASCDIQRKKWLEYESEKYIECLETPLIWAATLGSVSMIQLLRRLGARTLGVKVLENMWSQLEIPLSGRVGSWEKVWSHESVECYPLALLQTVAEHSRSDVMRYLLQYNIPRKPIIHDAFGRAGTPLEYALRARYVREERGENTEKVESVIQMLQNTENDKITNQ